jgi:hypothetical protein
VPIWILNLPLDRRVLECPNRWEQISPNCSIWSKVQQCHSSICPRRWQIWSDFSRRKSPIWERPTTRRFGRGPTRTRRARSRSSRSTRPWLRSHLDSISTLSTFRVSARVGAKRTECFDSKATPDKCTTTRSASKRRTSARTNWNLNRQPSFWITNNSVS